MVDTDHEAAVADELPELEGVVADAGSDIEQPLAGPRSEQLEDPLPHAHEERHVALPAEHVDEGVWICGIVDVREIGCQTSFYEGHPRHLVYVDALG